jgi:tetratricopeptide (TPR) repeat protein
MIETINLKTRIISTFFKIRFALTFFIVLGYALPAQAHEPGLEKIKSITAQLAKHGDSPQLYIQRARLFQDEQHWSKAMSDFNKAAELEPGNANINLDRARLTYEAKEYMRALDFIDLYLLQHESSTESLLIKARSFRELQQYKQAIKFFELALSNLPDTDDSPLPEWYVELASLYKITGDKNKALQAYQQGIDRLGPLSVFQVKAIELEVDLELYGSALNRIDQILSQSQRKDIWLARRADIMAQAGLQQDAQQSYQQAYAALQQLPQRLRNLPVTRKLEKKLQSHITSR